MQRKSIIPTNALDRFIHLNLDTRIAALAFQHCDYLTGGAIAKKLPEGLLVICNAMLFNQPDEIGWSVSRQR